MIFWAASVRSVAVSNVGISFLAFASSSLARSTFVPSTRTTSGIENPTSFAAAMIAFAMVSHLAMPPKMLTRMPFTFLSSRMILKASVTASSVADPPMSRKFAGSWPCSLMMSIVAMARPAPFTRQPMVPSSAMKFRSYFAARSSASSSSEGSPSAAIAFWRNIALSSKSNFASIARTCPSGCASVAGVTTSGLISASEASDERNNFERFIIALTAWPSCLPLKPTAKASSRAWYAWRPSAGSTIWRMISSGVFSATSSMFMPPSEEAIMTGLPDFLSISIAT